MKVWCRYKIQTRMGVNDVLKYIKHNNIKGRSIICSYIWHVDLSKCVIRNTLCESLVKIKTMFVMQKTQKFTL